MGNQTTIEWPLLLSARGHLFCRSNKSFSFVVNSIKRPSSTSRTKLRQSEIEGDDRLWTSNAAPVASSF